MLSVSILEMYAEGFESLVKLPKVSFKTKKASKEKVNKSEAAVDTEEKKPHINFFAGPNNVFAPDMEAAL